MPIHSRSLDESKIDEPKIVDLAVPRIIGVLPPIAGGEENLLRKDAWLNPLRVEFDRWSDSAGEPGMYDTVQLFFGSGTVPVHERRLEGPIPDTEFWLEVPPSKLEEGIHRLFYRVLPWNGSIPRESFPVAVTIDNPPPELAFSNQPLIDPSIIQNGLSEQYLIDHNGIVAASIPAYSEPAPGDTITAKWRNENNGEYREVSKVLTKDDYFDPIQLVFDEALIRAMGDGTRTISYSVFDRAGNESALSENVSFVVSVLRAPHFVPIPWIVEAEGEPSEYADLDPRRTVRGATAKIPDEAVYYDDDIVELQFGDPGTVGSIRIPVPWGEKEITIPPANIAAMFDTSVPVYYELTLPDTSTKKSVELTVQISTFPRTQFPIPHSPARIPFYRPCVESGHPQWRITCPSTSMGLYQ